MHVAARPLTAAVRGERETESVMAIPAEMEDHNPLNEREVHHLTVHEEMDVGGSTSKEEDPIINVRSKGRGKPIHWYSDTDENVSVPVCPSTSESSPSEKYFEEHAEEPPDVRTCRKRHIPPNMPKPVDVIDANCLPMSKSQEFSCQEDIKSTLDLPVPTREIYPVPPKKKRPDSPLKFHESRREKLKQIRQKEAVVTEQQETVLTDEVMLKVLFQLRKQGITINGQKFEVRLVPVQEVPQDKSYLDQHGFSPGDEHGEGKEITFVKKEAMPAITEAAEDQALPVFIQANAEQFENEKLPSSEPDGPLDLSIKGDQGVVVDDAGKGESTKIEEQELLHQEQPLDYSMQRNIIDQDMYSHTVAAYDEDCNNTGVGATGPGTEDDHDEKQEDEKEDEGACTAVEVANDNLPSLTAQAGNMSLASTNFEAQMAQPQATQPVYQAKLNLINYLAAQIATHSQRGQASEIPTEQQQQQEAIPQEQALGATVPNLNELDMTEEDGRLKRNKRDVTKDSLQRLLANRNR